MYCYKLCTINEVLTKKALIKSKALWVAQYRNRLELVFGANSQHSLLHELAFLDLVCVAETCVGKKYLMICRLLASDISDSKYTEKI